MGHNKMINAIGLMSGTSMDGVDIALLQSDGRTIVENKKFSYFPFSKDFRKKISDIIRSKPSLAEIKEVENEFTINNINFVELFLKEHDIDRKEIDLIAFPGHTIFHDPSKAMTWQIGDADLLEAKIKIRTIANFRAYDVARGGQGAPLVPIYHFLMARPLSKPLAILNIGGVSNITYIPNDEENDMIAFDICFGNAPFDDLVSSCSDFNYDKDGEMGLSGTHNQKICDEILRNENFYKKPPKSFDRNEFEKSILLLQKLDLRDSLASLAYIHAKILEKNIELFLNNPPKSIYICGGGLKNECLIKYMREILPNIEIDSTSAIGFDPDQIEAQAFAFLGIRRSLDLPISFQKTTGISQGIDSSQASFQR